MGGTCSVYGGEMRRMQVFWWGNLRERHHFEHPGVDWDDSIKIYLFRKWDVVVCAGSSWLRIGTGGGHLSMRY
jgi:hypothetical protein